MRCAQIDGRRAVSGCGYGTGGDGNRCREDEISKRKVLFLVIERLAKMRAYGLV